MDTLPNEVLEKILSYVENEKDLLACRFVGRRWNHIAVKYWRLHEAMEVAFFTDQLIYEFISEMDFRIQDFPFSKFRFNAIFDENVDAAKQFMLEYAPFIRKLDIKRIHDSLNKSDEVVVELLTSFNRMTNLEELKLHRMGWDLSVAPTFILPKLTSLVIPCVPATNLIAVALIKGAPNLQRLETFIDVSSQHFIWPLSAECREIPIICVKMSIKILLTHNSTALETLSACMAEWNNVRVERLILAVTADHPNLAPHALLHVQRLLDSQADSIKNLKLIAWLTGFHGHVRLPTMPKLENLKISYHHNRNPVQRIEGDPFAALKVVTLSSCLEPTIVFRPAVLASVQTFILYTVSSAQPIAGYTRWDEVFPNLEVFVYNNLNSNGVIDFPHFEFLVTHMQNPSLKTVEYTLHPVRANRKKEAEFQIKRILSGFENLDRVIENSLIAKEQGKEAEDNYWKEMEEIRRPSLTTMAGLKAFSFDHPLDDNLAIAVLLQMKPLDLITICSDKLSLSVFCEVINRHKSYCSIKSVEGN